MYKGYSQDELVDVLEKQCKAIHTNFKRTDQNGLSETLKEVIRAHAGNKIIAANDHRNEDYGLDAIYEELQSEGSQRTSLGFRL